MISEKFVKSQIKQIFWVCQIMTLLSSWLDLIRVIYLHLAIDI